MGNEDQKPLPRNRCRITPDQMELLASFMEKYPELALSRCKSRGVVSESRKKWDMIAVALNKGGTSARKPGWGWLRYWADMKFRVRRKYCYVQQGGKGVSLTNFERRLIKLLLDNGDTPDDVELEKHGNSQMSDDDVNCSNNEVSPSNHGPVLDVDLASSEMHHESDNVADDPIDIGKKSMEDIQIEINRFKLRRQKEMHDLEMEQMKERHKLEMDILRLRKRRLQQELKRTKKMYIRVEEVKRDGN